MEVFFTLLIIFIEIVVGYLIGTISFARIIASKKGVDITTVGSKNPGGTNVGRSVGRKEGISVMIIDIFKSFIPCLILKIILSFAPLSIVSYSHIEEVFIGILALFICLGHAYPIFFKFQGGKCVACVAGYLLLVSPIIFALVFITFISILIIKKTLSLSSVICSLVTIVSFIPPMILDIAFPNQIFNGGLYITNSFYIHLSYISFIFATTLALLTLYRHKSNIKRLIEKTEPITKFKHNEN